MGSLSVMRHIVSIALATFVSGAALAANPAGGAARGKQDPLRIVTSRFDNIAVSFVQSSGFGS